MIESPVFFKQIQFKGKKILTQKSFWVKIFLKKR